MLSNSEAARQARSEAARHAIESRWAKVTDPAQRRRQTQAGRVASAVKVVVENWPELRPEQVARLRALLQQLGGGQGA
jgi:hypothetical protein